MAENHTPIIFPPCPHQTDGWCQRADCWAVANGECRWLHEIAGVKYDNQTGAAVDSRHDNQGKK